MIPRFLNNKFDKMSKIVFYDIETTGLDSEVNGIHQLSGMIVVNKEVVHEFDFKFKPYGKIEPQALEVSGLTVDEVMSRGLMPNDAYRQFTQMLAKNCDKFNSRDKYHLCGYNNCSFDNRFLRKFWDVNDDRYFGSWFWSDSIDVMVLASLLLARERHTMENFKLMTVARKLGIEVDDNQLHDGLYDVKLTRQVFDICLQKWYK